jgi:hypothetical protein
MDGHAVYSRIVYKIKNGTLKEPFTVADFQNACPGLGRGTYKAFLYKHRIGNPGNNTELFEWVGAGKFKVIRPFKLDPE